MTGKSLETAEVHELIASYAMAAQAHGYATRLGDHQSANKEYEKLAAICRELRRRGPDAQKELLPLLKGKDSDSSTWAATHALEFAPEAGEAALKKAASRGGLAGFGAEMTLKEWKNGRLKFP